MDLRRVLSLTGDPLQPLEKSIYQGLKGLKGLLENQSVLIAVSGGLDSIVCLHVMHKLAKRFKIRLIVVHVNHQTRGRESDRDQRFVEALCQVLEEPIEIEKLEGLKSDSSEELMREKRYATFNKLKSKFEAKYVIVAHHRDDLLETRLMRLMHGTGGFGLKSMELVNNEGIIRPFINTWREDLQEYAVQNQIQWIEDSSNQDNKRLRNWIRNRLIRLLKDEKRQYIKSLFNSLEIISQEDIAEINTNNTLSRSALSAITSLPMKNRVVYEYLKKNGNGRITSKHVLEFLKRISSRQKNFKFNILKTTFEVSGDQILANPSD